MCPLAFSRDLHLPSLAPRELPWRQGRVAEPIAGWGAVPPSRRRAGLRARGAVIYVLLRASARLHPRLMTPPSSATAGFRGRDNGILGASAPTTPFEVSESV